MLPMLGFCKFIGIKRIRISFRNRERSPIFITNHFSNKNNLSNVIRIVGKLPINGFHDRMPLIADKNFAAQIIISQRMNCVKKALPTCVPKSQKFRSGSDVVFKFGIPFSPFFFTIGS